MDKQDIDSGKWVLVIDNDENEFERAKQENIDIKAKEIEVEDQLKEIKQKRMESDYNLRHIKLRMKAKSAILELNAHEGTDALGQKREDVKKYGFCINDVTSEMHKTAQSSAMKLLETFNDKNPAGLPEANDGATVPEQQSISKSSATATTLHSVGTAANRDNGSCMNSDKPPAKKAKLGTDKSVVAKPFEHSSLEVKKKKKSSHKKDRSPKAITDVLKIVSTPAGGTNPNHNCNNRDSKDGECSAAGGYGGPEENDKNEDSDDSQLYIAC